MSTRSFIGIETGEDSDRYEVAYIHFNGSFRGVGAQVASWLGHEGDLRKVIRRGGMSTFAPHGAPSATDPDGRRNKWTTDDGVILDHGDDAVRFYDDGQSSFVAQEEDALGLTGYTYLFNHDATIVRAFEERNEGYREVVPA